MDIVQREVRIIHLEVAVTTASAHRGIYEQLDQMEDNESSSVPRSLHILA
jgi:hypothetical protein